MGSRKLRSRPAVMVSLGVHAAAIALLFVGGMRGRVPTIVPAKRCCVSMLETSGGSHRLTLPSFELPNTSQSRHPEHVEETPPKLPDPTRPVHPAKAAPSAPPVESAGTGTGTAASGGGSDAQNATPAYPIFSPKPPVADRALLPASEQHIVVDVSVSEQGEVVGLSLVKGMGNALDQVVLDTVKTWRFHPATVNGNPVASEAELIFPFNPSYPVTRS